MKHYLLILLSVMMVLVSCTSKNGKFSNDKVDPDDAQTDDEKTLIAEFNRMIEYADSVYLVDRNDTLQASRIYHTYSKQWNKVVNITLFGGSLVPDIRSELKEKLAKINDNIKDSINNYFPNREYYYDYYENEVLYPNSPAAKNWRWKYNDKKEIVNTLNHTPQGHSVSHTTQQSNSHDILDDHKVNMKIDDGDEVDDENIEDRE